MLARQVLCCLNHVSRPQALYEVTDSKHKASNWQNLNLNEPAFLITALWERYQNIMLFEGDIV
jgi:hypothetical protein